MRVGSSILLAVLGLALLAGPVAANDPSVNHYNNIEELPKHFFDELRHFFEEYKRLENKSVKVEEFQDKTVALKIVEDAMKAYQEVFNPRD